MTEKKTPAQDDTKAQSSAAEETKSNQQIAPQETKASATLTPELKKAAPARDRKEKSTTTMESKQTRTRAKSTDTSVNTANKSSTTSKLALLLAILSIAGIGGHYYWQMEQRSALIAELEQKNSALLQSREQQVLQLVNQQQDTVLQNVNQQLNKALEQSLTQTEQLVTRVDQLSQQQPSDWLLHETEYLVRMAVRSLWLEKEARSAIALLQDADQRLASLKDPSLLPLRQTINEDIQSLQLMPTLETDEAMLKLMALSEQVTLLPIAMAHLPDATEPAPTLALSENTSDWRENLAKSWQVFLEQFITVRRRTANVEALLPPKQQQHLRQNLQLKLQLAQWAASQQKTELYQGVLAETLQWINEYFDTDAAVVVKFTEQISAMQEKTIALALPTTLSSLQAVRQYLANQEQKTSPPLASRSAFAT